MRHPLLVIRETYHPLHHLRKLRAFQMLTRKADLPVPVRFPGVSHPIYVSLSKNLSWVLTSGKSIEERERENFIELVRRGEFRRFTDVGANVGLYGFLFRALCPAGSVLMLEPDAGNAALIRRTIGRSGLTDIQLLEAAVSDAAGEITFHADNLTGATGSIEQVAFITEHHGVKPRATTIRAVTLDEMGGPDPDLLKIDVEGAELRAFRGAIQLLKRARPAIFFECDHNQDEVFALLGDLGYRFFDFERLKPITRMSHNTLALHPARHGKVLEWLAQ